MLREVHSLSLGAVGCASLLVVPSVLSLISKKAHGSQTNLII